MKHIRDFLYNFNDIVVALFILIAAAALIYWRVNVIMDYPAQVAANYNSGSEATSEQDDTSGQGDSQSESESQSQGESDSQSQGESQTQGEGQSEESPAVSRNGAVWSEGSLKVPMTVSIPSGSSNDAVQPLLDAGLLESYDEYIQICENLQIDPYSIHSGEFTFDTGYTPEDIVRTITGN